MGFSCGIVGLPNVGKSTLFNALTATAAAESANYPFCTIEPNVGIVCVPDERASRLAEVARSQKIILTQLEFVDIAGIVKGASKGEGLGNKFLANIREVDAILHVVRCFDNDDVIHVSGVVDPISDINTIETELLLADLESVQSRLVNFEKKAKTGDKCAKETFDVLTKVYEVLANGQPASHASVDPKSLRQLQLITSKPFFYVCNVDERHISSGNSYADVVRKYVGASKVVIISAGVESEIAAFDLEEERCEFLHSMGLESTGLSKVVRLGYSLLDLITYFTVGPKETRAWTIAANTNAQDAAGVIHTDFARGFICAETISWEDYVAFEGETKAKIAGRLRQEGKKYIVQDGDVMHFRFNV
jgi:GTP-binding protein YchF